MRKKSSFSTIFIALILLLLVVTALFPFVYMLLTSLKQSYSLGLDFSLLGLNFKIIILFLKTLILQGIL